jgi:phosphatidyl-myo-inositol dimannoside synthase
MVARGVAGSRGVTARHHVSCLALVTDAFGGRGGIAQYNRDFLAALAASGVHIAVRPRHAPDPFVAPAGVRQTTPRQRLSTYMPGAIAAAFRGPLSIVFCGHLHMAPLAAAIARVRRAKLVVQLHGIDIWPRPSWLRRRALEAADLVFCVSRDTRARALSWAALMPERVVVIPDTVGDRFHPAVRRSSLRCDRTPNRKRILLTVGRMDAREQYKGQDRVIRAMPQIVARGHDAAYVIVGDGDDRPRLEALCSEVGVADRVRFVGAVDGETLLDLYRTADLFVMPSTGEGFGITFLEAMACGTPALGLDAAGARDALAEGQFGALTSAAQLPETICDLLAAPRPDPQILADNVRARFGTTTFRRQVDAAFDRLVTFA